VKKKLFKLYLLGYLNEYYVNKLLVLNDDNLSYKRFKIDKTISYLNLPKKLTFVIISSIGLISLVEIFISIFILFSFFLYYVLLLAFTKNTKILNKKLVFGINDDFYYHKFVERINMNAEDFHILYSPCSNNNIRNDYGKIGYIKDKNWLCFKNFDFGDGVNGFSVLTGAPCAGNSIELRWRAVPGLLHLPQLWATHQRIGI
jgi:hypothetical protein